MDSAESACCGEDVEPIRVCVITTRPFMQDFVHRWRHQALLLSLAMVVEIVLPGLAYPRDGGAMQNLRFEAQGRIVHLYYDLNGDPAERYVVTITMKRGGDPDYAYTPLNVSGDIGDTVSPGPRKHIIWNTLSEFPNGLPGNDYYFVGNAQSTNPPLFTTAEIVGGAAVLGGTLLYFLLKKSPETPPPPGPVFPGPPGRP
jgi:hypothetical protein